MSSEDPGWDAGTPASLSRSGRGCAEEEDPQSKSGCSVGNPGRSQDIEDY